MKRLFEYALCWGVFLLAIAIWIWALTGFVLSIFFPLPR
jgi:hypothetical protein